MDEIDFSELGASGRIKVEEWESRREETLVKVKVKRIVEADVIVRVKNATRAEAEAYAGRYIEANPEIVNGADFGPDRLETYYGYSVSSGEPTLELDMVEEWQRQREKRRGAK